MILISSKKSCKSLPSAGPLRDFSATVVFEELLYNPASTPFETLLKFPLLISSPIVNNERGISLPMLDACTANNDRELALLLPTTIERV